MKKLNNKGFTLIEIVIVIVIIAILAAMLVPSLTQWIGKSKMRTFTSACGEIRTAVSSQMGFKAETGTPVKDVASLNTTDIAAIVEDLGGQDVGCTTSNKYKISGNIDSGFTVEGTGYKGIWNGSTWEVSES